MPNKSISYPKVSKRYDGLYYIDFKLNNKRIRMFSGKKIGSSTNPNTFPLKFRRNETINLAKKAAEKGGRLNMEDMMKLHGVS